MAQGWRPGIIAMTSNSSITAGTCLLFALFLYTGLAFAQGDEISPAPTYLEIPENAGEATVAVGETIAARVTMYTYRGIELLAEIDAEQRGGSGAGRPSVLIQPQYLVARGEDSKWVYFSGNVMYKQAGVTNMTGELGTGGLQNRVGGLRFSKESPDEYEIWVRQHRGRGFFIENPIEFREATIGAGDDLSTAVELVYGGRDGENLIVIYREHSGSAAEPVVNESVSLAMSSGPAFTVHGVRFEVIDATADTLTYKVLQNFQ